jgi:hypothetical protein
MAIGRGGALGRQQDRKFMSDIEIYFIKVVWASIRNSVRAKPEISP